KLLWRRVLMA
ncbi:phospho-2-dehydro-3-deoxyheptonate aldolase, partial [Chlamydia psittaci 03DC29]